MTATWKQDNYSTERKTAGNTHLAQWGLTWFIESFCFYVTFVLADNLVFQNPPLRQAWERYRSGYDDNYQHKQH